MPQEKDIQTEENAGESKPFERREDNVPKEKMEQEEMDAGDRDIEGERRAERADEERQPLE